MPAQKKLTRGLTRDLVLDPAARIRMLSEQGSGVVVDKSIPIKRYYRSGSEMERQARVYYAEGQLDKAFMLYNKFATLFIEKLPKHPEYAKAAPTDKARIKKLLKEAFPRAMELKEKLKVQFDQEMVEMKDKEAEEEAQRRLEDERQRAEERRWEEQKRADKEKEQADEIAAFLAGEGGTGVVVGAASLTDTERDGREQGGEQPPAGEEEPPAVEVEPSFARMTITYDDVPEQRQDEPAGPEGGLTSEPSASAPEDDQVAATVAISDANWESTERTELTATDPNLAQVLPPAYEPPQVQQLAVQAQPQPVPSQPQPVPSQPQPVPSHPQTVPSQPQPVPSHPQPVPSQPQPVPVQPQSIPLSSSASSHTSNHTSSGQTTPISVRTYDSMFQSPYAQPQSPPQVQQQQYYPQQYQQPPPYVAAGAAVPPYGSYYTHLPPPTQYAPPPGQYTPPPGQYAPPSQQAGQSWGTAMVPPPTYHMAPSPPQGTVSPSAPPLEEEEEEGPVVPEVDRSKKPSYSALSTSFGGNEGYRPLHVPSDTARTFEQAASSNTRRNVETCGILAGKLSQNMLRVTHIIIPKQKGNPDSCETLNEEEIFDVQDKYDLITLGWIHTHPSQTAFMSSVDLHTHCSYQIMMDEAVAIVCAPRYSQVGVYMLTEPHGLNYITNCEQSGFHTHPKEPPLYEDCKHAHFEAGACVKLVDMR